jgi:hypothetical protein
MLALWAGCSVVSKPGVHNQNHKPLNILNPTKQKCVTVATGETLASRVPAGMMVMMGGGAGLVVTDDDYVAAAVGMCRRQQQQQQKQQKQQKQQQRLEQQRRDFSGPRRFAPAFAGESI